MNRSKSNQRRGGFTLVEMVVTVGISVTVVAAILSVYLSCLRYWHQTVLSISTTSEANHCLNQMIYGAGTGMGLRASFSLTNLGSSTDWILRSSNYYGLTWYDYNASNKTVLVSNLTSCQLIGTNIIATSVTPASGSINLSLTVMKTDGRYKGSNTVSTFVKLRTANIR